MAQIFNFDSFDFSEFMEATDTEHKVKSSGNYTQDVVDYFHSSAELPGTRMPWVKTHDVFRFRPGEVTLWGGFNGSGKSMVLGQCCVSFLMQQQRMCIASMEMKPHLTLARMYRQASAERKPSREWIEEFGAITDPWVFLYDQLGAVKTDRMLAVLRYAAEKLKVEHFIIDSLMKCGLAEDDYTGQKNFVDQLCAVARDTGVHVHLVAHSRKGKDEKTPPGKMDVKGSGSITDQVDNVLTIWRNKPKEQDAETGTANQDDPDALLICDKQRLGEWEGRIQLWYDVASQQFMPISRDYPRAMVS